MSETTQTAEEIFDSLTGFDEMAITQHFGHTISDLSQGDASMFARALVFVLKRRDGANDDDARNAVLGMTIKEVTSSFSDTTADESGKDEQPAPQPETSLTSVS